MGKKNFSISQHSRNLNEKLAAFLSGEISDQERLRLMEWVLQSQENKKYFDKFCNIWQSAATNRTNPHNIDIEKAWRQVDQRTAGGTLRVPVRIIRIAAVVVFALLMGITVKILPDLRRNKIIPGK